MRKTALHVLVLLGAVLLLVQAYGGRRAEVARARAAASHLRLQRDSLLVAVENRKRTEAALTTQRAALETEAAVLRDSVAELERARAQAQLTVRQIRTTGALQTRLRAAFPELGPSGWGVTTLPFEHGDSLGLEYLLVPAWFAETFVIDHANAASWRAQKERLLQVDSLRSLVALLQDSILRLEAASSLAYQAGYQAAYTGYEDLSARYVAELRKPRISWGRPVSLIAALGAGLVLGRVVHE
jgi:exonuclease VII small subunit